MKANMCTDVPLYSVTGWAIHTYGNSSHTGGLWGGVAQQVGYLAPVCLAAISVTSL